MCLDNTGIFQATLWVDISLHHLRSWINLLLCEYLLWSYWCFKMVFDLIGAWICYTETTNYCCGLFGHFEAMCQPIFLWDKYPLMVCFSTLMEVRKFSLSSSVMFIMCSVMCVWSSTSSVFNNEGEILGILLHLFQVYFLLMFSLR